MQTFGQARGLPFTGYRKGIDARNRLHTLLDPIIASELATLKEQPSSSGDNDGTVLRALLRALAAGDLAPEPGGDDRTAVAAAEDALFLLFAGAALVLRLVCVVRTLYGWLCMIALPRGCLRNASKKVRTSAACADVAQACTGFPAVLQSECEHLRLQALTRRRWR